MAFIRRTFMQRYVPLMLFFLVLLTPFALKQIYGTAADTMQQGDGERLIIVTAHVEGIRREFAEKFSEWHKAKYGKSVYVDYRQVGGTAEIVKFFDATKRAKFPTQGTYDIDLMWGGGDTLFERDLKQRGEHLEAVKLSDETMRYAFPQSKIVGVPLYDDKDFMWYGTALSSFGITFNRDVCQYLQVKPPTTWADLADPKFRSWVILADPTRSGSVKQAFLIIIQRAMADAAEADESEDLGWAKGMGLIRQIAANARMFTDAGSSVPGFIASGDAAVGMTIDFFGRSQADAIPDNRLAYVDPINATAINADPIALIKGAPHREIAIRFIEFVLSEQGQRLWNTKPGAPDGPRLTALRRLPIAPPVFQDISNFTDPVNPYEAAGTFNFVPARAQTWEIIDTLIQVSCMDLLDDLRETRRIILEKNRPDLDAKLGTFPFDQQEALRRAKTWRTATALEKIQLQRQWREEFREEYSQLRRMAQTSQETP